MKHMKGRLALLHGRHSRRWKATRPVLWRGQPEERRGDAPCPHNAPKPSYPQSPRLPVMYHRCVSAPRDFEDPPPSRTAKTGGVRPVAFYLPQYFPIPENDTWWGPGFTEWTNTAKATKLFPGHRQPNLPADLGFYDLRVPETRQAQSDMAQHYGIEAFAYWHYWFGGGDRILERPFAEVLDSGAPDISFCLAWANQTWTGIWHGAKDRVLKHQRYPGVDDEKRHFETVLPALVDRRYLRVNDKPVFYIFRPEELPSVPAFIEHWRTLADGAGLPGMYFVAEASDLLGAGPRYTTAVRDGFDASVYMRMPAQVSRRSRLRMRLVRKLLGGPEIYPYSSSVIASRQYGATEQPCVYPNWDNTPRSARNGLVLADADPSKFEANVRSAVSVLRDRPEQERLLWVKSWNEWAEGNHLEPDLRFGHAWLEALEKGLA